MFSRAINPSKILQYFNKNNKALCNIGLNSNLLVNKNVQMNTIMHSSIFNNNRYFFSQSNNDKNSKRLSKQEAFKKQQQQLMKGQADQDPTTYDKSDTYVGKIIVGLFIIGLAGLLLWAKNRVQSEQIKLDQSISGIVQKSQLKKLIGGDWSLVDTQGKPISSSDLSGSYYLIYFGFTKCPDICPATLIKLSRVLKLIRKMPQYQYISLKIIFVSCDPDRDTPERMKSYLHNFDNEIIGVTGLSNTDPQLINCMKSFKIYSNKIDLNDGDYSMDHTTITYLMDDNNVYVDHINPNLREQQMAKTIVNRVLYNDHRQMQSNKKKETSSS